MKQGRTIRTPAARNPSCLNLTELNDEDRHQNYLCFSHDLICDRTGRFRSEHWLGQCLNSRYKPAEGRPEPPNPNVKQLPRPLCHRRYQPLQFADDRLGECFNSRCQPAEGRHDPVWKITRTIKRAAARPALRLSLFGSGTTGGQRRGRCGRSNRGLSLCTSRRPGLGVVVFVLLLCLGRSARRLVATRFYLHTGQPLVLMPYTYCTLMAIGLFKSRPVVFR